MEGVIVKEEVSCDMEGVIIKEEIMEEVIYFLTDAFNTFFT